jgi:hypothetical protein
MGAVVSGTRRREAPDQDSAARGQIAVATRQKSTARRLVSILAVREFTNPMLCGLNRTVTLVPGVAARR